MKEKKGFIVLFIVLIIFLFAPNIDQIWEQKDAILNGDVTFSDEVKSLAEENKKLKELLEYKDNLDYQVWVTKVKFRDIYDFKNELTILRGSDAFEEGWAVINEDGLIGTIKKVNSSSSRVRLLTNPESKISVKINDTYGILETSKGKAIVTNITKDENINVGDKVYTSGIGNLPGDIYVGEVKDATLDTLELEQVVSVSLGVDFNNLDYCLVVGAK